MNLREFAQKIGLSQTTVSRALSGYPEVKPATRERVLEAARTLGYRPNTSAIGLATGRVGAIGIVLIGGGNYGPHMTEFLGGLGARLTRDDVDILVTTVESREAEIAVYRRFAASKRVDAVILHSPSVADERIETLNALGLPFVLHGRAATRHAHAYLDIDNYGATQLATSHLIDLGHRRIALINGFAGRTFAEHRLAGFRDALADAGIDFDESLTGGGEFTEEMGFRLMSRFLDHPEPPTAVLAGSMMSALGAIRAARVAGRSIGADLSLIAHDDVFSYISPDNLVPTLTTTRSSMRAAGERIAELTLGLLGGAAPADLSEVWPVELVLRRSTAPAPA